MSSATTDYVPAVIEATRWEAIEPLVRGLLERPVETADQLEQWLLDRGELEAAVGETQADLYIAMSCNTEDETANKAYASFVESIPPQMKPLLFELDKRYVDLAAKIRLDEDRYLVFNRSIGSSVRMFRPENVPIQTELSKLSQEFGQIAGSMTVDFDGQERTLPQMSRYLEETDRDLRERAWSAINTRRLQDRVVLEELLDRMIDGRHRLATNADFGSYVDYAFEEKERFDYTPGHCRDFWDAVEKHVVPLKRRLDRERRDRLGVETLRPWDLAVDEKGRSPLRPFDGGRQLLDKTISTMDRLDPRLGVMLRRLDLNGENGADAIVQTRCLDLDSRRAKRPGGYQYERPRSRVPFIFMNAAGLQRDVITMIHEAGHAFHSMMCADEPLLYYRDYPIEFAEVASMAMEHLTRPHWGHDDGFYPDAQELVRAQRDHLTNAVTMLAWIASIDAFQHWLYANPGHSVADREAQWRTIDARFGHDIDWTGLEDARDTAWQRQSHIFSHPMYYIEYGIAELGALQLWLRSRDEGPQIAVDAYLNSLKLGGSRPLPELFRDAGLNFDFGEAMIGRLVDAVEQELATLPD